ncbi:MAG: HEPN domain-containing protein [Actinomycetota bacterium]|nr:HEPN domain-containing protein [Actinomycetota bacterium]
MSRKEEDLRATARSFVGEAFNVLRGDNVIPTPVFHPFLKVGRDYYGPEIMALAEFKALESLLDETYPERFSEPLKRRDGEFASSYIFSLLEASVARCGGRDQDFDPNSAGVDSSISEMLDVLGAPSCEVICCRLVAHLTTAAGSAVKVGDVEVVPEAEPAGSRSLQQRIAREIPMAWIAFNRGDPWVYDPPHALLIVRDSSAEEPYGIAERLSHRLERFLLLARLLTAGTAHSYFEVCGPATLVSRMSPTMSTFRRGALAIGGPVIRRTIRLDGSEASAFEALGRLIDTADIERSGMTATLFDVAINKFLGAQGPGNDYGQLVDLATALEAILAGGEKDNEGLTLRLRGRAAALLATETDPATAVFDDVGQLYGLRSKLVHGGQIKQRDLRKIIGRISTVPSESIEHRFGIAVGYALDRMRDLVRRSILARLCLASEPDPLWPFRGTTPVDAILSDDVLRASWRTRWRDRLTAMGGESGANPPRSAVDFLSQEDR